MLKKIIALALALVVGIHFSNAQNYTFKSYSIKEGLAQSQVRSVFQDHDGYLWIGTLGGASKFNGSAFVNYNRSQGLINNQINAITQLKNQQLVLGSIGGISVFEGNAFTSYEFSNDLRDAATTSMVEFSENELFIGTEQGLVVFQNNQLVNTHHSEFFSKQFIRRIRKTATNELYVGTREGIWKLQNDNWISVYSLGEEETVLLDFVNLENGEIYLATSDGGIRSLNNPKVALFFGDFSLTNVFTGIDKIADNLYFTSRTGVVWHNLSSQKSILFSKSNGLSVDDIRQVYIDKEGIPWFGSYGGGIFKLTTALIQTFGTAQGLSGNAVMTIAQSPQGNYFFGTYDNGLSCKLDEKNEKVNLAALPSSLRIWTSLTDASGNTWFGTQEGLYCRQVKGGRENWMTYTAANGLTEEIVLSLCQKKDGTLLIGTNAGIQAYANNQFQTFNDLPGFPETRIRQIIETKNGEIWMATRDGIVRFQNNQFSLYGEEQGITDASAYSIAALPNGQLVAGTQSGILVGNPQGFALQTISDLPGGNTVNFLKLIQNKLWIGTLNGIFVWELNSNGELSERIIHLNESDGLTSLETNLNAIYFDQNKSAVWVGTPLGVMRMDLSYIDTKFAPPIPQVHLLNILSNLESIDWKTMTNGLWNGKDFPNGLSFNFRQNSLSFIFDAATTTYPERLQFSYWLEGLDSSWSSPVSFSQVNFNSLPAGSYTFHVRARIGDNGTWSQEEAWSFEILPPWYLKAWVVFLEFVLVGLLVVGITTVRRRNLQNKHLAEQSELKAKLLVLEQQSMNSSMNRHFIFNALNSIQYYINRQDRLAANQYLTDFAKLIRKNLDSGQENFTPLSEEIERLELYLKLERMRFPNAFTYFIEWGNKEVLTAYKVPAMLFQPFLENSIWHGLLPKETGGELHISFLVEDASLVVRIKDNGIGLQASKARKTSSDGHISKGMEITKSRLDLIRQMTGKDVILEGPEDWNDENGHSGTLVTIRFPKDFQEIFA